jgi:protein-L-isoaspartate O-methyltransferase
MMTRLVNTWSLAALVAVTLAAPARAQAPAAPSAEVVDAMLKKAAVKGTDVVYVLGSGDGRIAIAAAKMGANKVVGVESDAALVKTATANAEAAGVAGKVSFLNQDPATASTSGATVVVVSLPQAVNLKISPKLKLGLDPDARVVAHGFNLGDDWWPDETLDVGGSPVFYWVVPYR